MTNLGAERITKDYKRRGWGAGVVLKSSSNKIKCNYRTNDVSDLKLLHFVSNSQNTNM